jgi:hypothetical protein
VTSEEQESYKFYGLQLVTGKENTSVAEICLSGSQRAGRP